MSHKDTRQKEPFPCKQSSGEGKLQLRPQPRVWSLSPISTKVNEENIRLGLQFGQTQAVSLGAAASVCVPAILPTKQAMIQLLLHFFCIQWHLLEFHGELCAAGTCLHFPLPPNKGDIPDGLMARLHFLFLG